jgi:putative transposase
VPSGRVLRPWGRGLGIVALRLSPRAVYDLDKFAKSLRGVALKKTYHVSRRRAAENFRKLAFSSHTPIQLTFPLADIAELAHTSLGDLLRGVGKVFIESVMQAQVEELAGKRSQPNRHRAIYRWGSEESFCLIDGQRVPIQRPRL